MVKYGRCGKNFGMIATSKKEAERLKDYWNKKAKGLNLIHKIHKCKKKYVVVQKTKRK